MLNLNYNINASNLERARFTEQENEAFRPFQIQYVIVPAGGGAAAGNNSFNSGSDLPKVGIAGNGGVIASGSFCVQPFITYPIVVGKGGKGGIATSQSLAWTGSAGSNSAFYNIEAFGGEGGKSQVFITSSTFAGNGLLTSASGANGGTGSQWTYNLPGCLPDPFNPGCHGGQLISESYYSGGGAGIVVSGSVPSLQIEYIVVGGGGGAMTNTNTCNSGAGYGGGGGAAISGSFIVEPIVKTYPIIVGGGGAGKYDCLVDFASNGSASLAFGVSAQGGRGANDFFTAGNSGTGSWGLLTPFIGPTSGLSAGGAGAAQNGTTGSNLGGGNFTAGNGGNGLTWVDGNDYAGGGFGGINGNQDFVGSYGATTQQYGYFVGRGGGAQPGNIYFPLEMDGKTGAVVIRYPGTGSKATGGNIRYDDIADYTYHFFSQSGDFVLNDNTSSLFTSGLPGVGSGNALFSPSGSLTPIPNTGGGAGATYYNQNGVSGSDGFVAIRYEGAPIAQGGNIVVTDYYTYHLFSSSADFYVIGNETNPNINPCA
jgi:hypothetical protein